MITAPQLLNHRLHKGCEGGEVVEERMQMVLGSAMTCLSSRRGTGELARLHGRNTSNGSTSSTYFFFMRWTTVRK